MAIFTSGIAVSAISGSVAGQTFSRNKGGQYIRARAVPIISTTSFALAAKTRLADVSQDWQGLTAAQRQAFQQWADANPVINALGKPITLSGAQACIGLNTRLLSIGSPKIFTPPIVPAPDPLITLVQSCDIGTGTFDLTFTATPTGATEKLFIRAAVTSSAGILNVQNLLRLVGVSAAAEASPFDHQTLVEDRLGAVIEDQTVHVEISVVDTATGLVSGPLRADTVVTDTP